MSLATGGCVVPVASGGRGREPCPLWVAAGLIPDRPSRSLFGQSHQSLGVVQQAQPAQCPKQRVPLTTRNKLRMKIMNGHFSSPRENTDLIDWAGDVAVRFGGRQEDLSP